MTPAEIIRKHASNQGLDANKLAVQVKKFLEQSYTKLLQEDDCLFLIQVINKRCYFYIVNGGSASKYLRALKQFVVMTRKMGCKSIAMRVSDQEQSTKIANAAGVTFISYKDVGGTADRYLMTMEI